MRIANNRFTTATRGAVLSSCQLKSLPANKCVPATRRYSGEMLNKTTRAAAFDGLRSAVLSVKIFDSLQHAGCSGGRLTKATDVTPEIEAVASSMRFCIAGARSALYPAMFK